jgi:hypothetical protein
MVRPQHIVWHEGPRATWTAHADGAIIGIVEHHERYELRTNGNQVRGSHSTLGNAQAQLSAWYSWAAAQQP